MATTQSVVFVETLSSVRQLSETSDFSACRKGLSKSKSRDSSFIFLCSSSRIFSGSFFGAPLPPNSPLRSKGQAQKSVRSGIVTEPNGFTAASAPTVNQLSPPREFSKVLSVFCCKEAVPIPPLSVPAFAPVPAPILPSGQS